MTAGDSKADALASIFGTTGADAAAELLPAGRVFPQAGVLKWFVDAPAASKL